MKNINYYIGSSKPRKQAFKRLYRYIKNKYPDAKIKAHILGTCQLAATIQLNQLQD